MGVIVLLAVQAPNKRMDRHRISEVNSCLIRFPSINFLLEFGMSDSAGVFWAFAHLSPYNVKENYIRNIIIKKALIC